MRRVRFSVAMSLDGYIAGPNGENDWIVREEDCPGVRLSSRPLETVAALRKAPGKDIWLFGGGELFRSMLELRLVDSVEVAVIPVLLGGGLPLLPHPAKQAKLKLARHRIYPKTGTVSLEYESA